MSPTMISWLAMRQRCYYKKGQKYKNYGAKGIIVCDRWKNSFGNFLIDMGIRPKGKTLDRFPNRTGNYEPENCRWATPKQQALNSNLLAKGWKRNNTHCPSGHLFSFANTLLIGTHRKCRTCARIRAQNKRDQKKKMKL